MTLRRTQDKRRPTHSFAGALAMGVLLAAFALAVVMMAGTGRM